MDNTFTTQFEMKKILTQVTVHDIGNNTFGCIISVEDVNSAAKTLEAANFDIIIKRNAPGKWEIVGEPESDFNEEDVLSLGNAIEGDKTVELFGPENY